MTDAPEKMFVLKGVTVENGKVTEHKYGNPLSSNAEECFGPLFTRSDLAEAQIAAAYEAAAQVMAEYHWNRYKTRDEGGELHTPAVFTSHTWQTVQEIIRALTPSSAKTALDALLQAERERCADKVSNFRAHLNFAALLDVMRDERMPPKAVNALSDFLDGIATAIRNLNEGEG